VRQVLIADQHARVILSLGDFNAKIKAGVVIQIAIPAHDGWIYGKVERNKGPLKSSISKWLGM